MSGPPPLRLRLPATSANLGPGFDALGLALGFALHVDAQASPAFLITASGRDADRIGNADSSLIVQTYREILRAHSRPERPLHLALHNEIPLGMGCGSSAAALVAGVALASHFGGLRWTREDILREAARREGHPDNVAACLLGGLTVSSMTSGRSGNAEVSAVSVAVPARWPLIVAMPPASLSTQQARALLPERYSKADAIANVQSVALLTAAFALGRGDLLHTAMQDRLHQPYRMTVAPLLPCLLPLGGHAGVLKGHGGVLGVALSGAGPSVLLILDESADIGAAGQAIAQALQRQNLEAELLHTQIGHAAVITPLDYS